MARLRDKTTPCEEFRALERRVSVLLIAEATRDLPTVESFVETPLERAAARRLAGAGGGRARAARGSGHARRLPRASALGRSRLLRPRAPRGDGGGAAPRREGAEGPGRVRSPSSSTPCSPRAAPRPWPSRACAASGRATSACSPHRRRPRGHIPLLEKQAPDAIVYAAALDRGVERQEIHPARPWRFRGSPLQDLGSRMWRQRAGRGLAVAAAVAFLACPMFHRPRAAPPRSASTEPIPTSSSA